MATPGAAWGIEIGAYAIKAIRLEREGEQVSVTDFAVIPHKKVLTTPDLDQDEMIRLGLGQLISQKSLENETLVMSVPGHAAFARFAKLPPVEPKKVPDIVKFEAVQQIPFPIDDVEWDYQTFTSEDTPEVEVGIFAITRERVNHQLAVYGELGLTPESLTLGPVAVYNAMAYDHDLVEKRRKPVVYLDIGTQSTDVVIAEDGRCWIRTFPLGGTHFTEAIAEAFKLSYSKAEKLKKEASTSKYAKQIMQAMRPVFSDLLQDLQRSIGYYQNLHRETELQTMIGVGSTFKIPGLRKFLGQQLQIDVMRLDEYKKINVTGREAASFAEASVNMATAYGLALQGTGLAEIDANLVPVKNLRDQMWHAKTKWFAAAAAVIIVGSLLMLYRPLTDSASLEAQPPDVVSRVISRGETLKSQYQQAEATANVGFTAENMLRLVDYRTVWPHLLNDANSALAQTNPQAELLTETDPEIIRAIDPKERRLVQLTNLSGEYIPPQGASAPAMPGATAGTPTATPESSRRILVTMEVELSHADPTRFLNDTVAAWLRDNAEREGVPYRIIDATVKLNPDQILAMEVDEDGGVNSLASSGSGTGARSGAGRPPSRSGNRNQGPTILSGGSEVSGGGAGTTGGGAIGRRTHTGPGRAAPGAGVGASGSQGGSDGATAAPPPGVTRTDPGSPLGPGRGQEAQDRDLSEMAPVPEAPTFYPAKSRFYRVPITFEVEIIDPSAPATPVVPNVTAAADGEEVPA